MRPSPLQVRLRSDVLEALKAAAKEHDRTLHGEIVARLESSVEPDRWPDEAVAVRTLVQAALDKSSVELIDVMDRPYVLMLAAVTLEALLSRLGAAAPESADHKYGFVNAYAIIEDAKRAARKPASARSENETAMAKAAEALELMEKGKDHA